MNNFLLTFNIVLPSFLLICFGYMIKTVKLVRTDTVEQLNKLIFKTFLPVMLFMNIYQTRSGGSFDWKLIGFCTGCVLVVFFILCLLIPKIEKQNSVRSVMIQGIYRSNFVIFGIPITQAILGSTQIGITAMTVAVIVPLYNFLAVVLLESYSGQRASAGQILWSVFKNPLIIGSFLGVLMMLLKVQLPYVVENVLSQLASAATPLALMVLGASFRFDALRGKAKQLCFCIIGKLVVVPVIVLPVSLWLGFSGIQLATIVTMIGAPTAVNSYTMAKQMGADGDLAGQIVVFTSMLCVLTMFTLIFICKQFCLF